MSSFQIATTNNAVKPSGMSDIEGVAYDPSTGNVWIADESKKTIKEYNPTTGAVAGDKAFYRVKVIVPNE